MKKIIKSILKLFIPASLRKKIRGVLDLPERFNGLSWDLGKIKTLLLLKEQSPELLHSFASGLCNDNSLVDALSQTVIFQEIQGDFKANMDKFLEVFIRGTPDLTIKKIYDNQLNIARNPLYKPQIFSNMLTLFLPHYEDEELALVFDQMYDPSFLDSYAWGPIQYMSWLLLRKEEERALDILKIYLKQCGLETLVGHLPLAYLAHRNGFSNEDVAAASRLFQTIINNVQNRMLEKYIEQYGDNPNIAIVGNGPQELGLQKGPEIDLHDIVVRCNSFDDSEIYAKDYGRKTNIVVMSPWLTPKPFFFDRKIDLFVTQGLYSEQYNREIILRHKEKPINNITTIDLSSARREIQEKYNLGWPTIGLRWIYFYKEILRKNLKRSDVYGMSVDTNKITHGHYADLNFNTMNRPLHNYNREVEVLQDLLKDRGEL